jgi:ribonuclease III
MRRPRAPGSKGAALEGVLGHAFRDAGLLEQALTHPSAVSPARPDNQRLEFLGDRVLGLCIAEALLEAYPDAAEGALAPRFNALVRRETLAEVAAEIGLGQHLRLGRSESISGGRRKAAILADATEAVIAALYLDGGMPAARAFIAAHWQGRLTELKAAPTDAKTRAQEWAQARGLAPPRYRLTGQSGPDHAPVFTVEAELETGEVSTGTAGSKKLAEQEAAAALLGRLAHPAGEVDSHVAEAPRKDDAPTATPRPKRRAEGVAHATDLSSEPPAHLPPGPTPKRRGGRQRRLPGRNSDD